MKKLAFFLFLLCFPTFVLASDLKLNALEIKNGKLSLPFDSLNNLYTITLEEDVESVDFVYEVDNEVEVHIENNENLQNNSVVTLQLIHDTDTIEYTFQILKEETEEMRPVFLEEKEEVPTNFMFQYKTMVIPLACLILLLLSYKIIFYHKK